jgi:16S rRNA (guanine527-N7)-methyltransferase
MNIIRNYFPSLTDKQYDQLSQLQDLYAFWNNQINLISRKDIENLYINHVLHSLSIAKLISFKENTTILDVGTGGGFPGIPLAVLFPSANFHLIDSIGKKIRVVENVIQETGLENATCSQMRAEQVESKYDFIVSRAVTALPQFYQWVSKKSKKNSFNDLSNGILYLKGGDIEKEIQETPAKKIFPYPISTWYREEYFLQKYIIHIPL